MVATAVTAVIFAIVTVMTACAAAAPTLLLLNVITVVLLVAPEADGSCSMFPPTTTKYFLGDKLLAEPAKSKRAHPLLL